LLCLFILQTNLAKCPLIDQFGKCHTGFDHGQGRHGRTGNASHLFM
jgi:hypothetical protein